MKAASNPRHSLKTAVNWMHSYFLRHQLEYWSWAVAKHQEPTGYRLKNFDYQRDTRIKRYMAIESQMYAIYCEAFPPAIRFNTIHGPTWDRWNGYWLDLMKDWDLCRPTNSAQLSIFDTKKDQFLFKKNRRIFQK